MSVTFWTVAVFGLLLCWPLTSGEGCQNRKHLEDFIIGLKSSTYSEPANSMTYFSRDGTIRLVLRLRGKVLASLQNLLVFPNNTKVLKTKFISENGSSNTERYESPSSSEQLWLKVSNRVVSKLTLVATEDKSSALPVSLTVVNLTACVVETAMPASPANNSTNITNLPLAMYNYSSIFNSTDNNSSLGPDGKSEKGTSTPSNAHFQNATENSTWTMLQGLLNISDGYNVSLSVSSTLLPPENGGITFRSSASGSQFNSTSAGRFLTSVPVLGETTTDKRSSRDSDETDNKMDLKLTILGVVFGALEVLVGVIFMVCKWNRHCPGRCAKRGVRARRVQHVSTIIKA